MEMTVAPCWTATTSHTRCGHEWWRCIIYCPGTRAYEWRCASGRRTASGTACVVFIDGVGGSFFCDSLRTPRPRALAGRAKTSRQTVTGKWSQALDPGDGMQDHLQDRSKRLEEVRAVTFICNTRSRVTSGDTRPRYKLTSPSC